MSLKVAIAILIAAILSVPLMCFVAVRTSVWISMPLLAILSIFFCITGLYIVVNAKSKHG